MQARPSLRQQLPSYYDVYSALPEATRANLRLRVSSTPQNHLRRIHPAMIVYYLKLYAITLVSFLAIDMVWLGLVARRFYNSIWDTC